MREPFVSRNSKGLEEVFGERGRLGRLAEDAYRHKLEKHVAYVAEKYGSNCEYRIFSSLDIPRKSGGVKHDSDVDIAIASGNKLLLIDVKRWSPGIYISLPLPRKSALLLLGRFKYSDWARKLDREFFGRRFGIRIGYEPGIKRVPLSRANPLAWIHPFVEDKFVLGLNMQMGTERYKEILEPAGVSLSSLVMFAKSPVGPHHVRWFMWPGQIRSISEKWSFDYIEKTLGSPAPVTPQITQLLHKMQRAS